MLRSLIALIPLLASATLEASRPKLGVGEIQACLSGAALLSDNPRCVARHPLPEGRSLCWDENAWKSWLAYPAAPRCLLFQGAWRARAPVSNDGRSKQVCLRFHARAWSARTDTHVGTAASTAAGNSTCDRTCRAWRSLERARWRLGEELAQRDGDRLGLARRTLLDFRARDSSEGILRLLGFVHVTSATGIHLYAAAAATHFAFRMAGERLGVRAGHLHPWARAASALVWLTAWALGGFRPGMLRPLIVIASRESARALGISWRPLAPLALALLADGAVAILRLAQGETWAPGRLHYALAVGGGLLALEWAERRRWRGFRSHAAMAVGSWLATAPVDLAEARWCALATPFLSLVTIPVFASAVFPLGLAAAGCATLAWDPLASELASLAGRLSDWVVSPCAAAIAALPLQWVATSNALGLAAILSSALLALPRAYSRLAIPLGLAWRLAGELQWASPRVVPARSVSQLDVGQGDAALVISRGSAGLIDVGSAKALGADDWIRILAREGLTRLDWIALTHLDEDHAGGLLNLARAAPIGCARASAEELASPRGREFSAALRHPDWLQSHEIPCVPFPVLPPTGTMERGKNAYMAAILVPLEGGGFYFSGGDASAKAESRMLGWVRELAPPGAPRILKISHHGSRFSTSGEFLAGIRPTRAWISSGVGNTYGHPSPDALSRIRAAALPPERTDVLGRIDWAVRPPGLEPGTNPL